jgi:hypothetical protein
MSTAALATPSESGPVADLIFAATGFRTGAEAERHYQPHALPLKQGCYALHLPSGRAGQINGSCWIDSPQGRTVRGYGLSWDSEYAGSDLRRITPAQYHAMPGNCKITSYETGIHSFRPGQTVTSRTTWTQFLIAEVDHNTRMLVAADGRAISFDDAV